MKKNNPNNQDRQVCSDWVLSATPRCNDSSTEKKSKKSRKSISAVCTTDQLQTHNLNAVSSCQLTCSKCGRDATNICYYQKDDRLYCSVCVYDFLKSQKDAENITVDAALREYGYRIKWYGIHDD